MVFLEKIKELTKEFSDEKFVFTKCNNNLDKDQENLKLMWLIVLEKMEYTKTNEDRKEIVDKRYAMYQADKLIVRKIININDFKTENKIMSDKIYIKVDQIVNDTYYFKDVVAAYLYKDIPDFYSGEYYEWYNNGEMHTKGEYSFGNEIGEWMSWHDNGMLKNIGKYLNGKKTGEWIYYHPNGVVSEVRVYINNKQIGACISWYDNGQEESRGRYSGDYSPHY
jgi:antitoxin component YwqK of YwqJK toxin-antitoxin module